MGGGHETDGVAMDLLSSLLYPSCRCAKQMCTDDIRTLEASELRSDVVHANRVEEFDIAPWIVESVRLLEPPLASMGAPTVAIPPQVLTSTVPSTYTEEDFRNRKPLRINGSHGPIDLEPPPGTAAGEPVLLRLMPPVEFSFVVPRLARPHQRLTVRRSDGTCAQVVMPADVSPGDEIAIRPRAVMVRVPRGAIPGDPVVFLWPEECRDDVVLQDVEWCRARVPQVILPGAYFAVRAPWAGDDATEDTKTSDSSSAPPPIEHI